MEASPRLDRRVLYGALLGAGLLLAILVMAGAALLGPCAQEASCTLRADGSCAPGPCDRRQTVQNVALVVAAGLMLAGGLGQVMRKREAQLPPE